MLGRIWTSFSLGPHLSGSFLLPSVNVNVSPRFARSRRIAEAREQVVGIFPPDCLHERVDVSRGLGAVIDVVRVLVHVECEDGLTARERVTMVSRPLVHEPLVAW